MKGNKIVECKILLIDSPADIILLKESITQCPVPIQLTCVTTITDALADIDTKIPDLIMVGSGIIIKNDFEMFLSDKTIPTVILIESDGFHKFVKGCTRDTLTIQRPFNLDGIPLVLNQAYDYWLLCRKEPRDILAPNSPE